MLTMVRQTSTNISNLQPVSEIDIDDQPITIIIYIDDTIVY